MCGPIVTADGCFVAVCAGRIGSGTNTSNRRCRMFAVKRSLREEARPPRAQTTVRADGTAVRYSADETRPCLAQCCKSAVLSWEKSSSCRILAHAWSCSSLLPCPVSCPVLSCLVLPYLSSCLSVSQSIRLCHYLSNCLSVLVFVSVYYVVCD